MFLKRQIPFNNLGPETTPTVKTLFDRYELGTYLNLTKSLRAVLPSLFFALFGLSNEMVSSYHNMAGEQGCRSVEECWERSLPTNVDRVRFRPGAVTWVCCWFLTWSGFFFLRVLQKQANEVASSLKIAIFFNFLAFHLLLFYFLFL